MGALNAAPDDNAGVAPSAAPDGTGRAPVALLEAIDRDGLVRQAWTVTRWPVAIGRALDNDVVLSDPHVAAHHARIAVGDAADAEAGTRTITIDAGQTRNGLTVGREHVAGGASATLHDSGRDLELWIGRQHLRLRLPGHALADEQVMAPIVGRDKRWLPTIGLALLVIAGVLFGSWLDTDPDNLARAAGNAVLTAVIGASLWCGLWSLLSKIFARQSFFGWHLRVALVAAAALLALTALPPLLAFAFSWPWITDFSFVAVYAAVTIALYFHLLAVEPARAPMMRVVAGTAFVVGVALSLWFNVQRTGRPGDELYMSHLFPPALRLARPISVDRLVDGLAPMQAILDRKARQPSGSDSDAPAGEGDDE
ncbi:MAG: FHA domain-containing protein [Caldimonas sp.]